MDEMSDTDKAINRRHELSKLTLDQIADFMAFLPDGSKTVLPFRAELARRVTEAQINAAQKSAEATGRNADYVLATLIVIVFSSLITAWISWLNYLKP